MAVEFETTICSKRKAPTGTMPVSECNRRKRNDVPWPARNGATPCTVLFATSGAVELAADATNRSYDFLFARMIASAYRFRNAKRTFHYRAEREVKSRKALRNQLPTDTSHQLRNCRKAAPRWLYLDFSSAVSSAKVFLICGK